MFRIRMCQFRKYACSVNVRLISAGDKIPIDEGLTNTNYQEETGIDDLISDNNIEEISWTSTDLFNSFDVQANVPRFSKGLKNLHQKLNIQNKGSRRKSSNTGE